MKKAVFCILVCCLIVTFSGCDLWLSGEYYSEKPHPIASAPIDNADIEVSSFSQLCERLERLVYAGTENSVIYYSGIAQSQMESYMEDAIDRVVQKTPIGAYAVASIDFDSGSNSGRPAIAVTISYNHGRSEILAIKQAKNMDILFDILSNSLDNCDIGVTVAVESFEEKDIMQFVQDYMEMYPDLCMELPQVAVSVYPEEGSSRIIEVLFSYQTSREELRKMQQTVAPIFDSAELYVSGDAESEEKYFQLYSFLMERHEYVIETSITPTYHLLRHGVGDSKAFATVYAAMCRRADLDCQVVTGTKDGESHYWNVIFEDGKYFFVDLLYCSQLGAFTAKTADDMKGYVWDYDLYVESEHHE